VLEVYENMEEQEMTDNIQCGITPEIAKARSDKVREEAGQASREVELAAYIDNHHGALAEIDRLKALLREKDAEIENLKKCLAKWQDGEFSKPKHILVCNQSLTDEQFNRLSEQCADNFGEGMFLLLEGGVTYEGLTR